MNNSAKKLAVIAGAGIAGLTAALALTRIGWRVIVVERAAHLRSSGYMLGLSGPGLKTMERMGLYDSLKRVSHISDQKIFYGRGGREILRLSFGDLIADLQYLLLKRTDITSVVYEAVKDHSDIRFGVTVKSVADDGAKAIVTLSDGSRHEADLVIGADGVHSQMRAQIFGPDENFLEPLGYQFAAYDSANLLGLKNNSAFYLAPRHFAEYYPLSDAMAALQVWPSKSTAPVPAGERWNLLRAVSKDAHPITAKIIDAADKSAIPVVDHLTLVKMKSWHKGRIVLLGDAAHCLTFISGQGAGMAITSAVLLADALAAMDVPEALAAHERRMRSAIEQLQTHSLKRADSLVPGSVLSYWLRNAAIFAMRKRKKMFGKFLEAERLATEALLETAN